MPDSTAPILGVLFPSMLFSKHLRRLLEQARELRLSPDPLVVVLAFQEAASATPHGLNDLLGDLSLLDSPRGDVPVTVHENNLPVPDVPFVRDQVVAPTEEDVVERDVGDVEVARLSSIRLLLLQLHGDAST